MKYTSLFASGAALLIAGVACGDVYDNGPFVTHPGGGFNGDDLSMLQNTSYGMSVYGFGCHISAAITVADEFEVGAGGWDVNSFTVYAYQTSGGIPSTLNEMHLQIWDGDPRDGGSSIVWGDIVTDVLDSTDWTGAYRALESDQMASNRAIMSATALVGTHLDAGTYWAEWQLGGTASSGPWAPPISILDQPETGNAIQYYQGAWQDIIDTGSAAPQGLPFLVDYGGGSDCLNMTVNALVAGDTGMWDVSGATPGQLIAIVWGTNEGTTNVDDVFGFCATFGIKGVNQNRRICMTAADGNGDVHCERRIPGNYAGQRVLTQAAERNTCPDECLSNLDDQVIG